MKKTKLVAEVIAHLNHKFKPTSLVGSNEEYSVVLLAKCDGTLNSDQYIEYPPGAKLTVGDLILSLDFPVPCYFYYAWKPVRSLSDHQGHEAAADQQSSLYTIGEESLSSMLVTAAAPRHDSGESLMASLRDVKPSVRVQSPFKNLFSHPNRSKEAFSKCDEANYKVVAGRDLTSEFSLGISSFLEPEESMISTLLALSRHNYS
jgi:hypothetical protein